jgi:hypothetical protein
VRSSSATDQSRAGRPSLSPESTEGPTRLTVAGLPALRIISHPQSGLTRRIATVYDGATAYVFDCGFTPEGTDEMKRGGDQVEDSFQVE